MLDEINMAKNEALAVLHAVLDFRRAIDVPGYERIPLAEETRFIATMNYGYAGTRELNEALTSRFVVIQMPTITEDEPRNACSAGRVPGLLTSKYRPAVRRSSSSTCRKSATARKSPPRRWTCAGCWTPCASSAGAWPAGAALDMGITNKAFDSYEQGLIRDVIAARIPAQLDRRQALQLRGRSMEAQSYTAQAAAGRQSGAGPRQATTALSRCFWPATPTAPWIFT